MSKAHGDGSQDGLPPRGPTGMWALEGKSMADSVRFRADADCTVTGIPGEGSPL